MQLTEWLTLDWSNTNTHVAEGSSSSLKVSLKFEPSSEVKIPVSLDQTSFVSLTSESELFFDSSNWDIAQTVSFKALDNDTVDGNVKFELRFGSVISSDPRFSNKMQKHNDFYHYDNDNLGLSLFDNSGNIINSGNSPYETSEESGGYFTFSVLLKSKPKDDVRVDITVSDDAEAFISTGSYLQFTKDNWDTAQSVVVSGLPDYFNDGDQDYQVILSTSQSQDMTYKDLGSSVINMKNINIDFNLNFLKLGTRTTQSARHGAVQESDNGFSFYILSKRNSSNEDYGAHYTYDISSLSSKPFSSDSLDLPSTFTSQFEKQGTSSEQLAGGSESFSFAQVKNTFVTGGHEFRKPQMFDLGTSGFTKNADVNNLDTNFVEVTYDYAFKK